MGRVLSTILLLKEKILKNAIVTAVLATVGAVSTVQAAWDAKYMPEPSHSNYMSDVYVAQGSHRTVRQMDSFDQPDQNGFLYVERVTVYDCDRNTVQTIHSRGFRTWEDVGQELKTSGAWQPVLTKSDQTIIGRMCSGTPVADANEQTNMN